MKILLTTDWHVNYRGTNAIFVKIALDYIDYIEEFCLKNEIIYIFFLGDVFEKSSRIRHDAFVPLFMKLFDMTKKGLKLFFILGNHDIYSIDNDSIVKTFSPIVEKVITDCEVINIGGREFTFLSYTKDPNKIPKSGDILMTHLAIADFEFDNAYHANEVMALKRDYFKNYNMVFSGHFHKPQHKDNITFVGSPYQLNIGERNQKKGFMILDTNGTYEFIHYPHAPEFIIIKVEDFDKVNVKNKFVYVEIEQKIDNFIKLKYLLFERGALDIVPLFKAPKQEIEMGNIKIEKHFSSIPEITMEYLKNIKQEGINNNKLVSIFQKILERVK